MDSPKFVIPQKAIIRDGEKFLIVKRCLETLTYPDCWDFPGGKLEHGEDPLKGLEREVKEETSLEVKPVRPVFTFHETLNSEEHVFIVYLCNWKRGEVKLSHEHTEYKWAEKEEILKLKTGKWLKAFLRSEQCQRI